MEWEDWLADQVREVKWLRGRRVRSWAGVEMALSWDEDTLDTVRDVRFHDPKVPCLQLMSLQASLGSTVIDIRTCQGTAAWGLSSQRSVSDDQTHWDGIYRWRKLTELPTGPIDHVSVFLNDDPFYSDDGKIVEARIIAEVMLEIDSQPLLLIAGQVHPPLDDMFCFSRLDDSVLVFTDPSAAESAYCFGWSSETLRQA